MNNLRDTDNWIDDAIDWSNLLQKTTDISSKMSSAKIIKGSNGRNVMTDTEGNDLLYGYGGNDDMIADWGNDTLYGGTGNDTLDSGFGRDVLYGESGNDVLVALEGNDKLNGGIGNDRLEGWEGNDTMAGGSGSDIFVFQSKLSLRSNVDSITDFTTADTVQLENDIFTKLTKTGTLSSSAFWTGSKAHDSNDRIIYNKSNGYLYYDQDGTGSKGAVLFAKLDKGLALTYKDFYVI